MDSLESLLKIELEKIDVLNQSYDKIMKDLETVKQLKRECQQFSEHLISVLDRQKKEREKSSASSATATVATVTPPSKPPQPRQRSHILIFDAEGKHHPTSQPNKKRPEKKRPRPQKTTSSFLLQRCVSCNLLPRYKNKKECLQCSNVPLDLSRCITINETGKNKGEQCLLPPEDGRQMCIKHLEDFIDVTKSDDSESESDESESDDSIVVSDHSSEGSLSDSEEEYEDERPLKRLRRNR